MDKEEEGEKGTERNSKGMVKLKRRKEETERKDKLDIEAKRVRTNIICIRFNKNTCINK